MSKRPPTGSQWRVLAHGPTGERVALRSTERPSVFDELVIDDFVHLEQMDTNHWWALFGGVLHVDVVVLRDGTRRVSWWVDHHGGQNGSVTVNK